MSWRRLRWRLRGAWLWPAFAVATFLAGLSLHLLPVQGLRTGLVAGLLIAGFVNLAAVALGMPLGGRLLRRGRDLPPVVAQDYGGCIALAVVLVLVVAVGALHHGAIEDEQRAAARALELVRHTVEQSGPAEARRNVGAADTIRVEAGRVYRSCIPTSRPERPYCLVVHLDTDPERVLYGGREPNDRWTMR